MVFIEDGRCRKKTKKNRFMKSLQMQKSLSKSSRTKRFAWKKFARKVQRSFNAKRSILWVICERLKGMTWMINSKLFNNKQVNRRRWIRWSAWKEHEIRQFEDGCIIWVSTQKKHIVKKHGCSFDVWGHSLPWAKGANLISPASRNPSIDSNINWLKLLQPMNHVAKGAYLWFFSMEILLGSKTLFVPHLQMHCAVISAMFLLTQNQSWHFLGIRISWLG